MAYTYFKLHKMIVLILFLKIESNSSNEKDFNEIPQMPKFMTFNDLQMTLNIV